MKLLGLLFVLFLSWDAAAAPTNSPLKSLSAKIAMIDRSALKAHAKGDDLSDVYSYLQSIIDLQVASDLEGLSQQHLDQNAADGCPMTHYGWDGFDSDYTSFGENIAGAIGTDGVQMWEDEGPGGGHYENDHNQGFNYVGCAQGGDCNFLICNFAGGSLSGGSDDSLIQKKSGAKVEHGQHGSAGTKTKKSPTLVEAKNQKSQAKAKGDDLSDVYDYLQSIHDFQIASDLEGLSQQHLDQNEADGCPMTHYGWDGFDSDYSSFGENIAGATGTDGVQMWEDEGPGGGHYENDHNLDYDTVGCAQGGGCNYLICNYAGHGSSLAQKKPASVKNNLVKKPSLVTKSAATMTKKSVPTLKKSS